VKNKSEDPILSGFFGEFTRSTFYCSNMFFFISEVVVSNTDKRFDVDESETGNFSV